MVKVTQDRETYQQKKIPEIFSHEKMMCENCQSHNTHPQTLGMDVAPKMYVGGGTLPFVFHVYVIWKYCMVAVNYK